MWYTIFFQYFTTPLSLSLHFVPIPFVVYMFFTNKFVLVLQLVLSFMWKYNGENASVSFKTECEKYVIRSSEMETLSTKQHQGEKPPWTCPQSRIVGGREALPKEFPHMALIAYDRWATKFFCGGAIISEYYILSAAHCQSNSKWGVAKWALLGDTDLAVEEDDTMPTLIRISSIVPHPDFEKSTFYNDILLFKLQRKILFSSFIRPICLADSETSMENKNMLATGWGRISKGSKRSKKLLKVTLTSVNESLCRGLYNPLKFKKMLPLGLNTRTMICAGRIDGRYSQDTCEGDSGGPLQILSEHHPCIYNQLGITSFGKICGVGNSPGVYTRTSYFIQWIGQIVSP